MISDNSFSRASRSLVPFLDRTEDAVAKRGYSRWMVLPAALARLCIDGLRDER